MDFCSAAIVRNSQIADSHISENTNSHPHNPRALEMQVKQLRKFPLETPIRNANQGPRNP
eukprot:2596068-Amphidinium_carterae.1